MNKKISIIVLIIALTIVGLFTYYNNQDIDEEYDAVNQQGLNLMEKDEFLSDSTEGIMLMIEFGEDKLGLSNFVNMLTERNIPGVLLVSPDYIEKNCETVKKVMDVGVELGAGINEKPLWDVPYEEQYELMKETKQTVKECTGEELKMFNSRYFAYDENTLKAAQELDIDYIFARGTTGQRATVYKPEEYDVKIFSVSNINSPKYGTGSLCDYSYWARAGEPDDFREEVFDSLKYDKISPVSHTYIGGLKSSWNQVYSDFVDDADVDWKTMDEFTKEPDLTLPFDEIPQNREVEYVEPKPNTPLEEEDNVANPCAVEELDSSNNDEEDKNQEKNEKPIVFHNDQGQMCKDMLDFFEENNYEFEEFITSDENFSEKLNEKIGLYEESKGVSNSFGYYPIIFVEDEAFSGFDSEIANELKTIINN